MVPRIIIVDDEDSARMSVELALKMAGYEVFGTNNAWEAVKAIVEADSTAKNFNLIITDLQMPGMSGVKLIEALNALQVDIPKLAITGFANNQIIGELKLMGCQELYEKPLEPKSLVIRVEEVLQRYLSRDSNWEAGILPPNPFRLARMETAFNRLVAKYT